MLRNSLISDLFKVRVIHSLTRMTYLVKFELAKLHEKTSRQNQLKYLPSLNSVHQ